MARSRDIIRKDGWASKAVDEWVCTAIGTGIKPQSMHRTLAVKEKIQALWALWANEADAAGMTDIYGLQALETCSWVNLLPSMRILCVKLPLKQDDFSVARQ